MDDWGLVDDVGAQLGLSSGAERVEMGQSNEVWIGDDWVLRVGGVDDSLLTEAQVVVQLPASVGYPTLIGAGRTRGRCWMVTERLSGQNLESVWPRLTSPARICVIRDLWTRINAVHATDLKRLPILNATPLYALSPARAHEQIALAIPTIGQNAAAGLGEIVAAGIEALDHVDQSLVHSDAGFGNAVWDGRAAVPVDFEFACVGPTDLDLERLARETTNTDEATWRAVGRDIILAAVRSRGGAARLRYYAVLLTSGPSASGLTRRRRQRTSNRGVPPAISSQLQRASHEPTVPSARSLPKQSRSLLEDPLCECDPNVRLSAR